MLQLGARYYWPEVGRFVQQDPIGSGVNWYIYGEDNPLVWIDPQGTVADWCNWDVIKAAAGGAAEGILCSASCNAVGVPLTFDDVESFDWYGPSVAAGGEAAFWASRDALKKARHIEDEFLPTYKAWKRAGGGLGPADRDYRRGFRWNKVTKRFAARAGKLKIGAKFLGPVGYGVALYSAVDCAKKCSP